MSVSTQAEWHGARERIARVLLGVVDEDCFSPSLDEITTAAVGPCPDVAVEPSGGVAQAVATARAVERADAFAVHRARIAATPAPQPASGDREMLARAILRMEKLGATAADHEYVVHGAEGAG